MSLLNYPWPPRRVRPIPEQELAEHMAALGHRTQRPVHPAQQAPEAAHAATELGAEATREMRRSMQMLVTLVISGAVIVLSLAAIAVLLS